MHITISSNNASAAAAAADAAAVVSCCCWPPPPPNTAGPAAAAAIGEPTLLPARLVDLLPALLPTLLLPRERRAAAAGDLMAGEGALLGLVAADVGAVVVAAAAAALSAALSGCHALPISYAAQCLTCATPPKAMKLMPASVMPSGAWPR